MARALGAPFVALPIFVSRGFHHGGLLVRPDANIRIPKDLEGKKVGVRAYPVTTGVWTLWHSHRRVWTRQLEGNVGSR